LAELARSYQADDGVPPKATPGETLRARFHIPYQSPFHRTVRLVGMLTLLASSLGLLASVAGLPLNWLSMLGGLLLSLILIGFSIRPSLRKPKF
jgi:hypothetical protein